LQFLAVGINGFWDNGKGVKKMLKNVAVKARVCSTKHLPADPVRVL